jgi:hypothetical protein
LPFTFCYKIAPRAEVTRVPPVQKAQAAPQQQQARQSAQLAPQVGGELSHEQIDAGPQASSLRQLQNMADVSSRTNSLRQLQKMADDSTQTRQLNAYSSMQQSSPAAIQMKAMQSVINRPALQRAADRGAQNGVAQLDELDNVENHVNPNYVKGSKDDATKNPYSSTPTGKFSSESSADKRSGVAKIKAEEEAQGIKVPHQPVADLGELYAHNAMLKAEYDHQVQAIATGTGGTTKFRSGEGMKSLGRTLEKIAADYGGDASRIIDLTGASIYYDSVDELIQGYQAVEANPFFNVVRVKNSLAKASGYGDINLAVEMGSADFDIEVDGVKKKEHYPGFIIELQLHLTAIIEQKEAGHKQYEEQRTIAAKFPNTKREEWVAGVGGVTKEDIENYDRLEKEMKAIYAIGWKKLISWGDFMNPFIKDKLQPVRDKLSVIKPKG